ncbi:DUF4158 domain-containing protein [Streptomyces sp. NPDC002896]|uniref:DUF4158 domain-containing protein n=1 Tax=Streptomyces sp. NPDC002896 TaxID=3154438 RepID=UPI0033189CFB
MAVCSKPTYETKVMTKTPPMALLSGKRGAAQLGFAVLLSLYTQHGRFPRVPFELPVEAVEFVARERSAGLARRICPASRRRDWRPPIAAMMTTLGLASDQRRRSPRGARRLVRASMRCVRGTARRSRAWLRGLMVTRPAGSTQD